MFNETVADIGRADVGTAVVGGVVGVVGGPLSFPSLFEPTRRIISGVEKSAGPSATYPGALRLSFLSFFAPTKEHYVIQEHNCLWISFFIDR